MLLHLSKTTDTGPKPFRYFNYWNECEGFKSVIVEAWSAEFIGSPKFHLVKKLKNVNKAVKEEEVIISASNPELTPSGSN